MSINRQEDKNIFRAAVKNTLYATIMVESKAVTHFPKAMEYEHTLWTLHGNDLSNVKFTNSNKLTTISGRFS